MPALPAIYFYIDVMTMFTVNPNNVHVNSDNRQDISRLDEAQKYNRIIEVIEFDGAVSARNKNDAKVQMTSAPAFYPP